MVKEYILDENYISVDEAAEYLGIKTVTLRNWIKKKPDIPAHRIKVNPFVKTFFLKN